MQTVRSDASGSVRFNPVPSGSVRRLSNKTRRWTNDRTAAVVAFVEPPNFRRREEERSPVDNLVRNKLPYVYWCIGRLTMTRRRPMTGIKWIIWRLPIIEWTGNRDEGLKIDRDKIVQFLHYAGIYLQMCHGLNIGRESLHEAKRRNTISEISACHANILPKPDVTEWIVPNDYTMLTCYSHQYTSYHGRPHIGARSKHWNSLQNI